MIIQLYQKGITTREIAAIIKKYMVAIIRHKLFLILLKSLQKKWMLLSSLLNV